MYRELRKLYQSQGWGHVKEDRIEKKKPKCHFKVLWLSWQVVPFIFTTHFYLWEELPFKEGERLVLTKKNISLETYLF